jgi:hypothetical protein
MYLVLSKGRQKQLKMIRSLRDVIPAARGIEPRRSGEGERGQLKPYGMAGNLHLRPEREPGGQDNSLGNHTIRIRRGEPAGKERGCGLYS